MSNPTIEWFARLWRRPLCSHDWQVSGMKVEGITLGWAGEVRRQLGFSYRCTKCPATKYDGGNYIPEDPILHPEWYGADGWPIDPTTGVRMEIA